MQSLDIFKDAHGCSDSDYQCDYYFEDEEYNYQEFLYINTDALILVIK